MHTQINIPTKSESVVLPRQGNTKTFQKDKSKQELLDHSLLMTTMIFTYALNKGLGVKRTLERKTENNESLQTLFLDIMNLENFEKKLNIYMQLSTYLGSLNK